MDKDSKEIVNQADDEVNEVNETNNVGFARYMKVSKPMVTKWDKAGRLVRNESGKILIKESEQSIKDAITHKGWTVARYHEMNRDGVRKEYAEQAKAKTPTQLKKEIKRTQLDLETQDSKKLFENSRALREKAAALQAQAEHEKFIGSLVDKEKMEKLLFERGRQFRDGLLINARRVSPLIVGVTDTAEIEQILTKEYRQLLQNFTKLPDSI